VPERILSADVAKQLGRDAFSGSEPLYQQLADRIQASVESGTLLPESRLPTVRELADYTGLSQGTVKHAYDELERREVIVKMQGRGTFVRALEQEELTGKKDRAMQAIDDMLNRLEELGFTLQEIRIFLSLKLRERQEQAGFVRVAVTDCNPEALHIISEQVAQLPGTEVQRLLLDDLLAAPYKLDEATDLLVTTSNHYDQVTQLAPEEKVLRVALSPSPRSVAELARLGGVKTGVLTVSEKFSGIIRRQLTRISGFSQLPRFPLGSDRNLTEFLAELDAVILPDQYARFCTAQELEALREFRQKGGILSQFRYRIDAGSLMFLQQRVEQLLATKR
jgi:DNA-binding transcriptional regulator YhcF (GntR family)